MRLFGFVRWLFSRNKRSKGKKFKYEKIVLENKPINNGYKTNTSSASNASQIVKTSPVNEQTITPLTDKKEDASPSSADKKGDSSPSPDDIKKEVLPLPDGEESEPELKGFEDIDKYLLAYARKVQNYNHGTKKGTREV